jgi:hypothetical protein
MFTEKNDNIYSDISKLTNKAAIEYINKLFIDKI